MKDMRELLRKLDGQGWTATRTRGGHVRLVSPTGAVVFVASTPHRGARTWLNTLSQLRRSGADL